MPTTHVEIFNQPYPQQLQLLLIAFLVNQFKSYIAIVVAEQRHTLLLLSQIRAKIKILFQMRC